MGLASHLKQTTYLAYLVLPRVAVGYFFLQVGWAKWNMRFLGTDALARQLSESVLKDPLSWHRDFIQGFVIPHSGLFSYIVCFGEIAIGLSLMAGCLVRISAAFGAFHNLNILFAIAWAGSSSQFGLNLICIALHLAFLFSGAGCVLGLDGFLKKKFPQSRLL